MLLIPQVSSPEDIQRIVQTVVETTAKIIVVFSSDVDLSPLVAELLRHNVTNRTWIATEAWVTSALMLQPGVSPCTQSKNCNQSNPQQLFDLLTACWWMQVSSLLDGTLGFAVKRAAIPGLQRYLLDLDPYSDSLTEEFWETVRVILSIAARRTSGTASALLPCFAPCSCSTALWTTAKLRSGANSGLMTPTPRLMGSLMGCAQDTNPWARWATPTLTSPSCGSPTGELLADSAAATSL